MLSLAAVPYQPTNHFTARRSVELCLYRHMPNRLVWVCRCTKYKNGSVTWVMEPFLKIGGRYWTRTSDLHDVNVAL